MRHGDSQMFGYAARLAPFYDFLKSERAAIGRAAAALGALPRHCPAATHVRVVSREMSKTTSIWSLPIWKDVSPARVWAS